MTIKLLANKVYTLLRTTCCRNLVIIVPLEEIYYGLQISSKKQISTFGFTTRATFKIKNTDFVSHYSNSRKMLTEQVDKGEKQQFLKVH